MVEIDGNEDLIDILSEGIKNDDFRGTKDLVSGLLTFGVEKEIVPYLIVAVKEPQQTEEMIDFLLDNPEATQDDILLKIGEIHKRTKKQDTP